MINSDFSRQEAMEKIIEVYSQWYILQKEPTTTSARVDNSVNPSPEITLVHSGRMDEEEGAYLMSRRAMIWEAESHEYVYFFDGAHLTKKDVEKALEVSYERGMKCIVPGPKHRCSYIAAVIVADTADVDAVDYIKKYRNRENFKMSLHGWMDQLVALVLPGKLIVSPGSKRMEDILEFSLDPEGYKDRRRGIKGFIRKLFR